MVNGGGRILDIGWGLLEFIDINRSQKILRGELSQYYEYWRCYGGGGVYGVMGPYRHPGTMLYLPDFHPEQATFTINS